MSRNHFALCLRRWSLLALPLCGLVGNVQAQSVGAVAASSVTFQQCYEWARDRSEDLKIRREDIEQSQARARSAFGSALPKVDWRLDNTWQDPNGVDKLERAGFSGFVEKEQTESRFSLEQPLFSGFREFSARSGFQRESTAHQLRWERALKELFERTASAFYDAVGHETDLRNTQETFTLAQDRVKELREFHRLGKARESEVFTAKAHAAALKAQLDQIRARITSTREELCFLTGQDLRTAPLQDDTAIVPPPMALEEALRRAEGRTDVRAQKEEVAAKKLRVRYERGLYWPTADLTGNYYTQRATFLKDIDWDVILSVDVPLYRGGTVSAQVQEALSAYRQSLLVTQQLERWVYHSVRKTHGELAAAVQEVKSFEEAALAAQQSYNALLKEYRLGLVTNLDVLQALDLLQDQTSERDAARIKAKRLMIQMHVAVEEMP